MSANTEQMSTNTELLSFPCEFSAKAMGRNEPDFDELIYTLVAPHVSELPTSALRSQLSKQNSYRSTTITFTATSRAQLDAIYHALSQHPRVLMAL